MQFGSNIAHGVTLEKLYFDTAGFVPKNAGQSPQTDAQNPAMLSIN